MPSFGSREDSSICSACGCALEVIGPPGPRHAEDCPYAEPPLEQSPDDLIVVGFIGGNFDRLIIRRRGSIRPRSE